ncbi:hypothetical protein CMI47_20425 [Candidatus Pacearchaeota archaeon]|nr:hypothetical protein [Candidatus Pacearchaeota archaeon]|tara:strand:- start:557 stop:3178 length:2622 start_codon:yes stop_codon:yes gene_type:complete
MPTSFFDLVKVQSYSRGFNRGSWVEGSGFQDIVGPATIKNSLATYQYTNAIYGSTPALGAAVYWDYGFDNLKKAVADDSGKYCLGLVVEVIPWSTIPGTKGEVKVQFDGVYDFGGASGFTEGDVVYVHASTPGALTNTPPAGGVGGGRMQVVGTMLTGELMRMQVGGLDAIRTNELGLLADVFSLYSATELITQCDLTIRPHYYTGPGAAFGAARSEDTPATLNLVRDDTDVNSGDILGKIQFRAERVDDGVIDTFSEIQCTAAVDWAGGNSSPTDLIFQNTNTAGGDGESTYFKMQYNGKTVLGPSLASSVPQAKGTLHLKSGDSGALVQTVGADDLYIENSNDAGLTFATGADAGHTGIIAHCPASLNGASNKYYSTAIEMLGPQASSAPSGIKFWINPITDAVTDSNRFSLFGPTLHTGSGTASIAGKFYDGLAVSGLNNLASSGGPGTLYLMREDQSILSGNDLGVINFTGDDPDVVDYFGRTGAQILGEAEGTWDANTRASRIVLKTNNGAASETVVASFSGNTNKAINFRDEVLIGPDSGDTGGAGNTNAARLTLVSSYDGGLNNGASVGSVNFANHLGSDVGEWGQNNTTGADRARIVCDTYGAWDETANPVENATLLKWYTTDSDSASLRYRMNLWGSANDTYLTLGDGNNSGNDQRALLYLKANRDHEDPACIIFQESAGGGQNNLFFENDGTLKYLTGASPSTHTAGGVVGTQTFTGSHFYATDLDDLVVGEAVKLENDKVVRCTSAKDKAAVGVFAGMTSPYKNSLTNALPEEGAFWAAVASTGDARTHSFSKAAPLLGFRVCNEGGAIAAGDLLCTSGVAGRLMKQDDDIVHSYTVGKALEAVSFDGDGNADGIYGYLYCG